MYFTAEMIWCKENTEMMVTAKEGTGENILSLEESDLNN